MYFIESIGNLIHFWMYEVSPSILESRLLGSNNIVDAAVVGIPDKENGQVRFWRRFWLIFQHCVIYLLGSKSLCCVKARL